MIVLHTMVVVIMDIILNHIHQLYLAGKSFAVVACPLQNIPESLDGYPKRHRFIAINDGVDNAQGENDFAPLRNLV